MGRLRLSTKSKSKKKKLSKTEPYDPKICAKEKTNSKKEKEVKREKDSLARKKQCQKPALSQKIEKPQQNKGVIINREGGEGKWEEEFYKKKPQGVKTGNSAPIALTWDFLRGGGMERPQVGKK